MRSAMGLAILGLAVCMMPRPVWATPKIVVVPAQAKGAPNLKTQIASFIEKSLKQSVTVVSFTAYSKAAKAAGVRAKSLTGPEAAVPGGKGVGASHVLIIQSVQDKPAGSRKPAFFAAVTLVDAATGETLLSKRYPLEGKRLDATAGSLIVGDVLPRLQAKGTAAAPAPVAEPSAPAIVAPEPPPPPTGTGPQAPSAPPPLEAPPPPTGPPEVPHNQGAPPPPETVAQNPNDVPPAAVVPPPTKRNERWRPGLRAALAYFAFFRTGHINAQPGDQPPCYCEPSGVAPPAFSRGDLQLEVFPMAFTGDGSWYEGFGVHGEGSFGVVHTGLASGDTVSSNVGGANGGLQFRYVLWDSITATDLQLRLGVSLWSFPLNGSQFPGVQYKSPYVGLHANIPITDAIGLFAQALYQFRVVSGGTQTLGKQLSAGSGVHAELGARLTLFDLLEIKAQGNFDDYSVPFAGITAIPGTNLEYQNVTLSDLVWGFGIGVGIVL